MGADIGPHKTMESYKKYKPGEWIARIEKQEEEYLKSLPPDPKIPEVFTLSEAFDLKKKLSSENTRVTYLITRKNKQSHYVMEFQTQLIWIYAGLMACSPEILRSRIPEIKLGEDDKEATDWVVYVSRNYGF